MEFITPIGIWMAATYRYDERAADVTRTPHVGWILFLTVIWSLWVQLLAIAAAILIDRSRGPGLPHWLGYLNLWVAMLIIPAGLVVFFKQGPFAWTGLVGPYIPLTGFVVWIMSMTITNHRNLSREIAATTSAALEPIAN